MNLDATPWHPRNWLMALLLQSLKGCHLLLPYRLKLSLCRGLGRGLYHCARRRRHIVDVNARLCFPALDDAERQAFVRQNFEDWGVSLLEMAMGWWGRAEPALASLEVRGEEHFRDALDAGNGVILLGAHFTSIDLGSTLFRRHFGAAIPVHVVHRLQNNQWLNAVMTNGRLRNVSSVVSKDDMRAILRLVRGREVIWYAADQDFGLTNSVFAPFFNHPAATLTATARLAGVKGAPVVMMGHYRQQTRDDDGRWQTRYVLEFFAPLVDFPSGDAVQDATAVNQIIATAIERAPTQYMWLHRRFKNQPDLPLNALYRR